jgi:formyltetrahydrofolate deformylase
MNEHYSVLIHCNDEKGLVYKVSSIFFHRNLNIISNNEFVDKVHNKFFMRSVVAGEIAPDELKNELRSILPIEGAS